MLKYVGLAVGALAALLLLLMLAVALFFDPNDYKDRLQRVVEERTGRELQLAGPLELAWFPWLAVEFGPATLGNAAGFGEAPFLEIGRARLGVRIAALVLRRRLEFDTLRIERPVLRLAMAADGRNNWSDLVDRLTAEPAAPEAALGGPRLTVAFSGLRVTGGALELTDARDAGRIELKDLDVETGAPQAGVPFGLRAGFTYRSDPAASIATTLAARTTLDPERSRLRLDEPRFDLRLQGGDWPSPGLPLSLRSGPIELDWSAQTLAMPQLVVESLGARLTGDLTGRQIVDDPRISGPLRLEKLALRDWLIKAGIELPATRDPKALGSLELSGQLAATPKAFALESLKLRLDDSSATGRLGIDDLDAEVLPLRFELSVDRLDLDRYLPPDGAAAPAAGASGGAGGASGTATRTGSGAGTASTQVAAAAASVPAAATTTTAATAAATGRAPVSTSPAAEEPFELPVELLRGLDLVGLLELGRGQFAGMPVTAVRLGVNAQQAKLRLFPLEAALLGGRYRGDLRVDASGGTPRLQFDESLSGIDLGPLLGAMFDTRRFSGRGTGTIRGEASGADSTAWLRSATGNLRFEVADGAVDGADLWYEIRRARALLRRESLPARPAGPPRTPFTRLQASGRLGGGALQSDDLAMDLQYLRVAGRGRVDLVAGTLDWNLDTKVLRIPDDDSSQRELVDLSIPVRVTGSLDDPSIRPDLAGLAKAQLRQELEKRRPEIEEKKQELENKLRNRLQDLFKR